MPGSVAFPPAQPMPLVSESDGFGQLQQTLTDARTRQDTRLTSSGEAGMGEPPVPPAMNPRAGHTFSREQLDGLVDLLPNQGTAPRRPRKPVIRRETTENFAAPLAGPPAPPPKARRDTTTGADKKNV